MSPIRIILADDHPIVREGIRNLLERAADIEIVGEAHDGLEALRLVKLLTPDVLLLDMEMPGLKGVDVARQMKHAELPTRILALSAYDDKQYILGLLAAGAVGYLTKEEVPEVIVEVVRGVAHWLYESRGQRTAGVTLPLMRRLARTQGDRASLIMVKARSDRDVETLAADIRSLAPLVEVNSVTTLVAREAQTHTNILGAHVTPFSLNSWLIQKRMTSFLIAHGSHPVTAGRQSLGMLFGTVERQSTLLAFLDVFNLLAIIFLLVVPLVLLMKRAPRAPRGGW